MAVKTSWPGRSLLLGLACAVSVSAPTPTALALDFKIDLPPQRGVVSPDDEMFFDDALSVSEEQANSLMPNYPDNSASIPSPVPPLTAVPDRSAKNAAGKQESVRQLRAPVQIGETALKNALPNIKSFPNPSCLSENVSFWKRVYSEIDSDEVLVHDREEISRIYATVRLGGGDAQRRRSMRMLNDHYRTTLRNLADKVNSPEQWNSTEKAVAKLFNPSELSRSRLLQASENIRSQQGLKSRFNAGVQRSLQYLPTIKKVLRTHDLPLDIAFLPHVESSFVNHAKSKVGAVGLWQLMPQTMQLLMGRKAVNRRTEPTTATMAAAKLLKQNFEKTGSWPLALTAYNHGLGGVMRAVRATSSTDLCKIIERYNSPSFKFASSNFYAQFIAARQIATQRYAALSKNREVGRIVAPLVASREKGAL